jgi:hypothetical protein
VLMAQRFPGDIDDPAPGGCVVWVAARSRRHGRPAARCRKGGRLRPHLLAGRDSGRARGSVTRGGVRKRAGTVSGALERRVREPPPDIRRLA